MPRFFEDDKDEGFEEYRIQGEPSDDMLPGIFILVLTALVLLVL